MLSRVRYSRRPKMQFFNLSVFHYVVALILCDLLQFHENAKANSGYILFCLCYKMTHGIFTDFYFLQIFDFDFFI